MNDTQQILKAIQDVEKRTTEAIQSVEKSTKEAIQDVEKRLDEKLEPIKSELSHLKTASEAIIAGLTEVAKAVKSDKEVKIRLKNLEEHTGTTNPIKN